MSAALRAAFARCAVVVACALFGAAASASAEPVFRCGNSYSPTPCEGASALDVGAALDPRRRAEADAVAARERTLAVEMTRGRRERERVLRPAAPASLSAPPAATQPRGSGRSSGRASKKHRDDPAERSDFVAVVPSTRK
jgi:hypothetical protein